MAIYKILKVGQSSASAPHVTSTGVFVENPNTLYPSIWSLKEVFGVANKAIGLSDFVTFT